MSPEGIQDVCLQSGTRLAFSARFASCDEGVKQKCYWLTVRAKSDPFCHAFENTSKRTSRFCGAVLEQLSRVLISESGRRLVVISRWYGWLLNVGE